MSIYYVLDGNKDNAEPRFIASNTGWGEFITWVESLPSSPTSYANLLHLVLYGWSEDLPQVLSELQAASRLDSNKPDANTLTIVRSLLSALNERGEATVLTITDGMTNDKGSGKSDSVEKE